MSTKKKSIELSFHDCRMLRGGLAELLKRPGQARKFTANRTRLRAMNEQLAKLFPGQALGSGAEGVEE